MRSLGPLVVVLALAVAGCDSNSNCSLETCDNADVFATEDITPPEASPGATLQVNDCFSVAYVGRLAGGDTFQEGTVTKFYNNSAGLIQGFLLGLNDQRVGETRRVTIPPSLGYKACPRSDGDGNVTIPACSTLEFDLTLTAIHQDNRVCTGGV